MKRLARRRTILLAAATAAIAATAGADMPHPTQIEVAIAYEGGGTIPKGELVVYLDGAASGPSGGARINAQSDGGSRQMNVLIALPPSATGGPLPRQVVARLQRTDGWLIARGSTQVQTGAPATITLHTVMY